MTGQGAYHLHLVNPLCVTSAFIPSFSPFALLFFFSIGSII